jgi:nicotinate-nucleotide adenylyltransferase
VRKVGIYGGTFDPIHHAHLILAREALEHLDLAEAIFVPAAISPHKLGQKPTDPAVRLEMLRAAVAGEPRFTIDEQELHRPAPSFTVDTMEEMARANPEWQLFYLIGSDNLAGLETWHRIADLRKVVEFVVLDRGPGGVESPYRTIRRPIDISSTEIRKRVADGRSIRYLVPTAVEEIIRQHHLYQESHR